MADYNVKEIAYGGNNYKMYPANLTSETQLQNAAQDATEIQDRVYPVRLDANGKLAVNVPWTSSGAQDMTGATASTAGTHGLVPAPAAGDQGKVLTGGGTWEIIPEIKVGKISGTTNNNGILVTDVLMDNIVLLSCWASDSNCATPYRQATTGILGFRISNTSGGSWTVVGNANRTVWYSYIDRSLPAYT